MCPRRLVEFSCQERPVPRADGRLERILHKWDTRSLPRLVSLSPLSLGTGIS